MTGYSFFTCNHPTHSDASSPAACCCPFHFTASHSVFSSAAFAALFAFLAVFFVAVAAVAGVVCRIALIARMILIFAVVLLNLILLILSEKKIRTANC